MTITMSYAEYSLWIKRFEILAYAPEYLGGEESKMKGTEREQWMKLLRGEQ